jgi:hypothetical protein
MPVENMPFPMKHPEGMFASQTLDSRYYKRFYTPSLFSRIKTKLLQWMGGQRAN